MDFLPPPPRYFLQALLATGLRAWILIVGVIGGLAGVWADYFGWEITPLVRAMLWTLVILCLGIAPVYVVADYIRRQEREDTKRRELQEVESSSLSDRQANLQSFLRETAHQGRILASNYSPSRRNLADEWLTHVMSLLNKCFGEDYKKQFISIHDRRGFSSNISNIEETRIHEVLRCVSDYLDDIADSIEDHKTNPAFSWQTFDAYDVEDELRIIR